MGLKEEYVELELGLSLGGNYRNVLKAEKEIQGLQKQEVKRKREEKEMNDCNESVRVKLGTLGGNGSGDESYEEESRRICKKNKVNEEGLIQNDMGSMPVQYLYPYPYPYSRFEGVSGISLMPCWYGKEGNGVVDPVMSYGLVPFRAAVESGLGNDLEQNGSMKEEKKRGGSFLPSSTSRSSDPKTSSSEGGGSNDSRSHSIYSLSEQCNGSKSSNSKSVSEHSATSNLSSALVNEATNHSDILVSSNSSQSCLSGPKEALLETESENTNREILTPANQTLGSSMETKREMGKPPKPHIQKQNTPPSFSFMPCVSTRGDGPDGKTINGFLHRYTKTEVSIICICHGSTFSPAEFVQHAGGKDVSHPLRHITVMPPTF